MKYKIGQVLQDTDGNYGIVCVQWNDGDLCFIENDAAHPNPVKANEKEVLRIRKLLESWGKPVK
jgi:hypothetical protein